ncbi:MAG: tetratricopeptide repeat protein [candidate division Zixibacteria bacterium]|nr:tetratricopeptide repeat protein [candidate division Zixibacteria bacterium]
MNKCPNCQHVILNDAAKFCDQCGYTFQEQAISTPSNTPSNDDDDLEFVVTEAHQESPDLVGQVKTASVRSDDDLGLQSNADLMENEAKSNDFEQTDENKTDFEHTPIGDTAPPPPPEPDYDSSYEPAPITQPTTENKPPENNSSANREPEKPSSPAETESSKPSYLSDEEKRELISKIENTSPAPDDQPFGNQPIQPPKKNKTPVTPLEIDPDLPKPAMAKRSRGIANFYRNFIQLKGDQQIHDHDEMTVNDRLYVLREKKLSPKVLAAIATPIFILILFLIGAQFIRDTGSGQGRIVGMVFDENEQPYLQQAIIRIPELGEAYTTNTQGFFKTDFLPAGSYTLEYIIHDAVVAVDHASIFGDEITTLKLIPRDDDLAERENTSPREVASAATSPTPRETAASPPPTPAKKVSSESSQSNKASSSKSGTSKYAKLTLAANIDGARLKLDGSVLGAGNLTYSQLKPGEYAYAVSKEGYQTATGKINLTAGKTSKLEVKLKPLTTAQKEASYNETDFYYAAEAAYKEGDNDRAIEDLTKAINLKNSYAEAYFTRGEIYSQVKQWGAAHDDFVRAAEIYQFRKEINQAITAYNKAIEIDQKSITAHLGRANLYLNKGEEIAAIADYETVIDLDKRNFQAYYGLGEARFKQGYYKKAIKHFKDARSVDSENPKVYQYLMLSYLGANDIKNVKKSYEKFKDVASEEEFNRMNNDSKYSAVMRVVETD